MFARTHDIPKFAKRSYGNGARTSESGRQPPKVATDPYRSIVDHRCVASLVRYLLFSK